MSWHDELGDLIEREGFGIHTIHSIKNKNTTDYKALLKKYIEHVVSIEGIDFLSNNHVCGSELTSAEIFELKKISED